MSDETSGEQYELGPAWVRVTSNEDYWREMPVTNKGEPLPGKLKREIIRILHECQVWIDKSVPRVTFWHHEARRVMPNCDPRDRFVYPYLTRMMDSFSCTP